MKKIKVSVIVPCYNAKKYLDKCLNSLINQTMKEIEIICVNDGSIDNTINILRKYQKNDKRITVINKENGGVSSARNEGIKFAHGEYIIFIDSDDYVDINMFSDMYQIAMKTNSDIVKCNRCDVYNALSNRPTIINRQPIWNKLKIINKDNFEKELYIEFFGRSRLCNVFTMLINRHLIIDNNINFSMELKVDEDEIFVIQVLSRAARFTYIPNVYYYYIKNLTGLTGSGTNIYDRFSSRKEHINILKKMSSKWKIDNYDEVLQNKIGFVGIYTAMQTTIKNVKFNRREQYELFKQILYDDLFKDAIVKSDNTVLLLPEKIFSYLIKRKRIKLCFYYSRLFEEFLKKYRNKIEIIKNRKGSGGNSHGKEI